jgi:hypothetical protein
MEFSIFNNFNLCIDLRYGSSALYVHVHRMPEISSVPERLVASQESSFRGSSYMQLICPLLNMKYSYGQHVGIIHVIMLKINISLTI